MAEITHKLTVNSCTGKQFFGNTTVVVKEFQDGRTTECCSG